MAPFVSMTPKTFHAKTPKEQRMDSHPSPTPYVKVPEQVQELQERFLMHPQDEARARILLELGRLSNLVDDEGRYPYREAVARTLVELHNLSVWLPEKRAIIRAMGECRNSEVIFRFLLRTLDVLDMDDHDGPDLVTAVIDAFGRITLPASGPVLLKRYLTDVPEIVRLQAIEVLGHLGFSEAEGTIVAALDEGSRAQIVALYALTELVSPAGLERVEEILENAWQTGELEQDEDRELARAALIYLSTLGCPQAEKWVTRLRYTHGPDLRCLSLWGRRLLRQYASDDLLDLITSALEEEDDYTRMFLGRNLRRYDPEEVLETGEVFCETEKGRVRLIKTVAEIGGPVITEWLWDRFISGDATARVRATAIRALRSVGELEGRRLVKLAPDADPLVATAAIRTASNFGPLELYEPLVGLLENDEPMVRQEAVRGIQHLLLAHRPAHVVLRENKGDARGHRPDDLPLDDDALEVIDAGFRKILKRDDDGMTQGLVAYAAANLRRFDLRPRVIRLAERSQDNFARMAAYHALLDMPDTDQVDRIMEAFAKEQDRLARSACIRTLAPLLASMDKPDGELEQRLISAIVNAIDDASAYELVIYAYALGLMRVADPLPVLDRISARGGYRSNLEVISALGQLRHLSTDAIMSRIDAILGSGDNDQRLRAIEALSGLRQDEATDRLIQLFISHRAEERIVDGTVRALAALGRERHGLSFSNDLMDAALERVSLLLRDNINTDGSPPTRTFQEDLLDLKLALWQATSASGVDDDRVNRVITQKLGDDLKKLTRYTLGSEEVLRALRGAEFFHLQSREMPLSADLSPAILSYTKAIELWLHLRLTDLLGNLRDVAKRNYQTIMENWDDFERVLRKLVTIPVEDTNRAVDWTKVPRVAKAMKEKKFTADWRTLSISNSGAIVIFFGVDHPDFGCENGLGLHGDRDEVLSVAVNALALAALRNAMAHEQSASRQDLEACRNLAYTIMQGIASWG
ncbi:MAG: hypothetical protein CMH57_12400 [Myxococcales bacterium]|nr:hypothetical protein [Myxococcales bacterium]